MSVLQTEVLPIEYDEKTKRKAYRIKKLMHRNPAFFKAFLKDHNKISCIDQNSSLYIEKGQSILKYLDGIPAFDATFFLKEKCLSPELAGEVMFYWENDMVEGRYYYPARSKRVREVLGVYDYFHTKKDYEELYRYLHGTSQITKEDIFSWLQEQYRFQITNQLLEESIRILLEEHFPDTERPSFELLEEILETARKMQNLEASYLNEIPITYSMNQKTSIALYKEFLTVIDPSLELVSLANQMEQDGVWIENKEDPRLQERKDQTPSSPGLIKGNPPYIYMPWTNTINDSSTLVHEFFHYLGAIHAKEEHTTFPLQEAPSLFFEQLFLIYLVQKNFPDEVMGSLLFNRRLTLAKNAEDLYDFLSLAKKGTVTQEIELELLKENAPEGIKDKMTFSLAKESCDRQNQLLIQDPFLLSELYPYVIGAEISEELLERLPDQPETILNMIFLAKEAENLSLEESLERIKIYPNQKPKIKTKE